MSTPLCIVPHRGPNPLVIRPVVTGPHCGAARDTGSAASSAARAGGGCTPTNSAASSSGLIGMTIFTDCSAVCTVELPSRAATDSCGLSISTPTNPPSTAFSRRAILLVTHPNRHLCARDGEDPNPLDASVHAHY